MTKKYINIENLSVSEDLNNFINGDIQKIIDEIQLYQNTEKLKESGEVL